VKVFNRTVFVLVLFWCGFLFEKNKKVEQKRAKRSRFKYKANEKQQLK